MYTTGATVVEPCFSWHEAQLVWRPIRVSIFCVFPPPASSTRTGYVGDQRDPSM